MMWTVLQIDVALNVYFFLTFAQPPFLSRSRHNTVIITCLYLFTHFDWFAGLMSQTQQPTVDVRLEKCAHDLITNSIRMAVDEFLFLGFQFAPRFLFFFRWGVKEDRMGNDPERQSNKLYDLKLFSL